MVLFQKKLLFVTGKGGVGKTTLAILVARQLAEAGKKVLFLEIGQQSSGAHLGGFSFTPKLQPQASQWGFDVALANGSQCLEEYANHILKVERLAALFLKNKFMQALLPLAPGLDDLAVLGKLTSEIRKHGPPWVYDHIVVDCPSTGAFLSMLKSPKYLSEIVSRGPLSHHSQQIFQVLSDPAQCQFLFLTLLEGFPVDELVESSETFQNSFGIPATVVVNKILPGVVEPAVEGSSAQFQKIVQEKVKYQKSFLKYLRENFYTILGVPLMLTPLVDQLEGESSSPLFKTL